MRINKYDCGEMIIEELKTDEPLRVGCVTLIPIVKKFLFYRVSEGVLAFSGLKRADFVVVLAPWGMKALKTSGDVVSLDELLETVPELSDCINRIIVENQLDDTNCFSPE